jgi:hypothetical protein
MKIGDRVFYSPIIGDKPVDTQTYKICRVGEVCGTSVAWLRGKAGCVAIEALTLATQDYEPSFH